MKVQVHGYVNETSDMISFHCAKYLRGEIIFFLPEKPHQGFACVSNKKNGANLARHAAQGMLNVIVIQDTHSAHSKSGIFNILFYRTKILQI